VPAEEQSRRALCIMDMQRAVVGHYGGDEAMLDRVAAAIAAARAAQLPVIYVVHRFRRGMPEVSRSSPTFIRSNGDSPFVDGAEGSQIHPHIAPAPDDIIVPKRRTSAFAGSDLELILRAQEITTPVLTGISTSGVVLSTLRAAADLGFRPVVLSDCCDDPDPVVHQVLTEKVFPMQAEVLSHGQWIGGLTSTA
jgi:nicotinamidase-related amidase